MADEPTEDVTTDATPYEPPLAEKIDGPDPDSVGPGVSA
jgi:hypothetical protein